MMKCKICEDNKLNVTKRLNKMIGWGDVNGILFVGMNPSIKRNSSYKIFDDDKYKFFIDFVKKYNVHKLPIFFTNIVKCSTLNNRLYPSIVDRCTNEIFRYELACISPSVIVALGHEVYKYIDKCDTCDKVIKIHHPSYISRFNKHDIFEKQIKELFDNI